MKREKSITKELETLKIYQFGSSLNSNYPNDIDILIIYRNRTYEEIINLIEFKKNLKIRIEKLLEIPIDIILLSTTEEKELSYLSQINYTRII